MAYIFIKFSEELVYRSSTDEIIGYVDYGNETYNDLSKNGSKVSNHVLAVYVRGGRATVHLGYRPIYNRPKP